MKELVMCVSNSYTQQYYLDKKFDKLPKAVKDELAWCCSHIDGAFKSELGKEYCSQAPQKEQKVSFEQVYVSAARPFSDQLFEQVFEHLTVQSFEAVC